MVEGDWVVFQQSEYERKIEIPEDLERESYSPTWSLPAKVERRKDLQLTVRLWGTLKRRDVPISKVRKLVGVVPPLLAEFNMKEIQRNPPRLRKRQAPTERLLETTSPLNWKQILDNADEVSKKRTIENE